MEKIRFGLVGCGNIAHIRYFYSFQHLNEVELVGIYDIDTEFLKKTAEELKVKAFDTYEDMLKDPTIDAIIVTTYHPTHTKLALQAIAAGKHVLSEKPVATSMEDAFALKAAVEASDRIFMALPNDAYPQIEKVKKLLADNVIGDICSVDGLFAHQGPLHAPWFFDYKKAEWGVLADLGIYPISVLTYLFGPVNRVCGETRCLQKRRISERGEEIIPTVEDNIAAILSWSDGKLATIRSNWCTAAHKDACLWELKIYGSKGIIHLNMMSKETPVVVISPYAEVAEGKKIRYQEKDYCYNIDVGETDSHIDVMKVFINAIKKNEKIPDTGCSVVRQAHVIEIIDKLYKSSRNGQMYELTSTF